MISPFKIKQDAFAAGVFSTSSLMLGVLSGLFFYQGSPIVGSGLGLFAVYAFFSFAAVYPQFEVTSMQPQDGESVEAMLKRAAEENPGHVIVRKQDGEVVDTGYPEGKDKPDDEG